MWLWLNGKLLLRGSAIKHGWLGNPANYINVGLIGKIIERNGVFSNKPCLIAMQRVRIMIAVGNPCFYENIVYKCL